MSHDVSDEQWGEQSFEVIDHCGFNVPTVDFPICFLMDENLSDSAKMIFARILAISENSGDRFDPIEYGKRYDVAVLEVDSDLKELKDLGFLKFRGRSITVNDWVNIYGDRIRMGWKDLCMERDGNV